MCLKNLKGFYNSQLWDKGYQMLGAKTQNKAMPSPAWDVTGAEPQSCPLIGGTLCCELAFILSSALRRHLNYTHVSRARALVYSAPDMLNSDSCTFLHTWTACLDQSVRYEFSCVCLVKGTVELPLGSVLPQPHLGSRLSHWNWLLLFQLVIVFQPTWLSQSLW